jgi:hypothetical protein
MRERDLRGDWAGRFAHAAAEEIRSGVHSGALTGGEAEELLARLLVVVDQALDRHPLPA